MKYIKRFFLAIWQLPQIIVALAMWPFLGKKTLVDVRNGVRLYRAEKMSGGISLGYFIYLSPKSADREATRCHEMGHTKDSRIFGPLYLLVIGLPSIMWAVFKPEGKCYYDFYTERRANKWGGVSVGRNRYGCYTYIPNSKKAE